jgi:HK97 family phage major capsid protein
MNDKKKWFAANFGRTYFKSQPLQIPFMAVGLALPIIALAIIAVVAFTPHAASVAGLFCFPIPITGIMKTDRVVDLTKKISERSTEKDAIKKAVETEQRAMTPEEKKKVGELLTEIRSLSEELTLEQEELAVDDIVNQSRRAPIRPTVDDKDEIMNRFIHLPKKELRYSTLGEFVSDTIQADPRRAGKISNKLAANMEMARASGMNETSPADGGFLVQPDMSSRLIEPLFAAGGDAILSRLNTTNVSGNGLNFKAISETTKSSSSWGGIVMYWLGEAAEKTASAPKLRDVTLKLKKIAGLMYLTDELLEDAPALSSRIERGFQIALKNALIKTIISGTGAGQPLGLLNSSAKISITGSGGAATVVTDDILAMRERLTPGAISPVWLYNPTVYKQLFQLQVGLGTAGALVSGQTIQSAGMQSMLGIPLVECPWCSVLGTEGDLILTDLGQYEFIQKGGPQVAYSIHVKFIYDETAMRIVYRCDGMPSQVSATTLEDGTTTASPIVTLATRS